MSFTTHVNQNLHQHALDSLDALCNALNVQTSASSASYDWGKYLDCVGFHSFAISNTVNAISNTVKEDISSMDKTAKSEESKKPTVNITENQEAEFTFTHSELDIKRVIFSNPCTIILWKDGTKTIVRVREGEEFSPYQGFCAAIAKKMFGSNNKLNKFVDQWVEKNEKK